MVKSRKIGLTLIYTYIYFFYSVVTEMSTESDVVRSTEVKRSKNCLQGASDLVV